MSHEKHFFVPPGDLVARRQKITPRIRGKSPDMFSQALDHRRSMMQPLIMSGKDELPRKMMRCP